MCNRPGKDGMCPNWAGLWVPKFFQTSLRLSASSSDARFAPWRPPTRRGRASAPHARAPRLTRGSAKNQRVPIHGARRYARLDPERSCDARGARASSASSRCIACASRDLRGPASRHGVHGRVLRRPRFASACVTGTRGGTHADDPERRASCPIPSPYARPFVSPQRATAHPSTPPSSSLRTSPGERPLIPPPLPSPSARRFESPISKSCSSASPPSPRRAADSSAAAASSPTSSASRISEWRTATRCCSARP